MQEIHWAGCRVDRHAGFNSSQQSKNVSMLRLRNILVTSVRCFTPHLILNFYTPSFSAVCRVVDCVGSFNAIMQKVAIIARLTGKVAHLVGKTPAHTLNLEVDQRLSTFPASQNRRYLRTGELHSVMLERS